MYAQDNREGLVIYLKKNINLIAPAQQKIKNQENSDSTMDSTIGMPI